MCFCYALLTKGLLTSQVKDAVICPPPPPPLKKKIQIKKIIQPRNTCENCVLKYVKKSFYNFFMVHYDYLIYGLHIIKRVGGLYIYERWGLRHHCASVLPGWTGG